MGKALSLAMVLGLGTATAAAQGNIALHGQWDIAVASQPNYVGTLLVDAERRATWESPDDYGKPVRFVGFVRLAGVSQVEIVLTNRARVVRVNCLVESKDLLHCHILFEDGKTSPMFAMSRVGPGPVSLAPSR